MKSQAVIDKCQVEIVDLKGTYLRSAGIKSASILDGTELCRVEEFVARYFRRSGFEATFLESAPFHVLFGVYFWPVIQDRSDPRVRMVGIGGRHAYDQRLPSELMWIQHPSDFGTADYARRRAKAITKHLAAIAEDGAELLRLFDNWLAPSVGLRQYLWAHRREAIETIPSFPLQPLRPHNARTRARAHATVAGTLRSESYWNTHRRQVCYDELQCC